METDIEERRSRLQNLEAEISDADTDLETKQEEKAQLEDQMGELKDLRSRLEDIRYQIETSEETIDSLQREKEDKKERKENLVENQEANISTLREELNELREQKRQVNTQMSELQSIIQFNEEMLDGTDSEITDVLRGESPDDSQHDLTDQLLEAEESIVCWTCGSQVSKDDIEDTLDKLRSFRQEKLETRQSVQSNIDETKEQVSELERTERGREDTNQRLAKINEKIGEKESQIGDLKEEKKNIQKEIESLEETIEEGETTDKSEVLELHKKANAVELELDQKKKALESTIDDIEEIESLLSDCEELKERRNQIVEQLKELRNRIDRLEKDAIEKFNDHMEKVFDILDYKNISRIWIERLEREVRQGRQKVSENYFELHVVRQSESGETYEGTIGTLSESEREVVGLVFALAGYLVHHLYETVPVMLLDSLETIDSDRIAQLIEYFADYPDFLVVALLPEDANAVEIEHTTVTQV